MKIKNFDFPNHDIQFIEIKNRYFKMYLYLLCKLF